MKKMFILEALNKQVLSKKPQYATLPPAPLLCPPPTPHPPTPPPPPPPLTKGRVENKK